MDKASRTAELAALARASHAKEALPLRGPDDLAAKFLSPPLRVVAEVEPVRRVVLRSMAAKMPGVYATILCRSRVFDEFALREIDAGARQLVVLGAGYDTRAYRFRDRLVAGGARVFEVDAPPTSRRKREKVRKVLGAMPDHVAYVEVDFNRDTMEGPLLRAGYDPSVRTAFTWEGVCMYLTEDAVSSVLSFVVEKAGAASAIVFDYVYRSVVDGTSRAFGAVENSAFVRERGEPFTFGLEPDELAPFVRARGLAIEDNALPEALAARYLEGAPTRYLRDIAGFYAMATARKVRAD